MVQRRGCAGLTAEALKGLRVLSEFIWQEFQGDESAKPTIFGFVNDAHSSATQLLDNAVVRNGLADHQEIIWR
jgi:hypothetical protein